MRVDELGIAEPVIVPQGKDRIRIRTAQVEDEEQAREIIGRTAGALRGARREGDRDRRLKKAVMDRDPYTGEPFVGIEFDQEGAELFAKATGQYLGRPIYIYLDEEVISAPTVQSVITDGNAMITGEFTAEEAGELALLLRSGALPVELRELESRLVGPTLGERTEEISVWAAGAGLLAVILFMILYYRLAGLIAGIAQIFYMTLVLGILILLPTTLTLPGMAGLILSIGMAVDANVIIFERIKDELRSGRTLRSAIENGFQRAFRTILTPVTTIIATVVLFFLTSGPVRGFAVTLFIGIASSMFTAITLTRFLLRLTFDAGLIRSGRFVGENSMISFTRHRNKSFLLSALLVASASFPGPERFNLGIDFAGDHFSAQFREQFTLEEVEEVWRRRSSPERPSSWSGQIPGEAAGEGSYQNLLSG